MIPLQDKHSFSLPARAHTLLKIQSVSDLEVIEWSEQSYILGAGSNTIFTTDYEGEILLNHLKGADVTRSPTVTRLRLAAGENWHHWVYSTVKQGIGGLENLALIPGTIGAAPVQNIGAYGVEISRFIEKVEVYDLVSHKIFALSAEECDFSYRHSIFKKPENRGWFITHVTLGLPNSWQGILDYPDLSSLSVSSSATEIMEKVMEVRQKKLPDPKTVPNAGSFFKNPVVTSETLYGLKKQYPDMPFYPLPDGGAKIAAGWLIEHVGMKNYHVGGAGVHAQQALVLVNKGGASGSDVTALAREIKSRVEQKFGLRLEPEVRILGSKGPISV